ncbi:hypothetical protein evm_013490 [Chilo suppressalis]|nr:hypothetical protein evm_013490 [Chilo suppressalis]
MRYDYGDVKPQRAYTLREVAERDGEAGRPLFIIVDNNVYDITEFADFHPAGPEPLKEHAGRDATAAIKYSGMPSYVYDVCLNRFLVGWIPINAPTAGAQAFPMDGVGRLGQDPPREPSADWWVLTTADATGTNGLTCLPKHGRARESKFSVTHPMTDHCESCLTSTIAAERANQLRHRAPQICIDIYKYNNLKR